MSSTNGANGHSVGETEIPVTKLLAAFIGNATTKSLSTAIREKVKEVVIDYIGVVVGALDNADSTEPIYRAIVALQGEGNSGRCTVRISTTRRIEDNANYVANLGTWKGEAAYVTSVCRVAKLSIRPFYGL